MNSTDLILLTDHSNFVFFVITLPLVATLPFSVRHRKRPRSVPVVLFLDDLLLGPLPNCLHISEEIILKQLTFLLTKMALCKRE